MTSNRDDAALMRGLGDGDLEALGELVRRHQHRALSVAYRMLGRWDLAEDVVQDAFILVYRAAPRYRPEAPFLSWLYRIVTNLCLDEKRRAKSHEQPLPDPASVAAPAASSPAEAGERAAAVRRAVASLPQRQRAVVILHRYERLSYAEVAEATGWSESAVESLLVRAYAHLRRELSRFRDNV